MSSTAKGHYERGTTLPETVIVIAVALALLFGIIDFGRAIYTYGFVANLARQGARWAIVRGSNCTVLSGGCPATASDIQTYVRTLSEGATDSTKITVNTTATSVWPGQDGTGSNSGNCIQTKATPGCLVVVTVTYPFSFILPYMPKGTTGCGLATASICMSSTSKMVISQ
jgi:Flp pilus assembly protein TadG